MRRLDGVLEPTKARVLEAKGHLKGAPINVQVAALRRAASQTWPDLARPGGVVIDHSRYALRTLTTLRREQKLRAKLEADLKSFRINVQNIRGDG